ncbi:MAG: hypothetical protein K0R84_998 [Clostridia bacterium]|jgi:hypothetical protein|nr:hypothetical protein [Clostridia bacterium]
MGFNLLGFDLDDNIIWILAILLIVFFLFPAKKEKKESRELEVEESNDYIYRRSREGKEKRRLVY